MINIKLHMYVDIFSGNRVTLAGASETTLDFLFSRQRLFKRRAGSCTQFDFFDELHEFNWQIISVKDVKELERKGEKRKRKRDEDSARESRVLTRVYDSTAPP